MSNKAQNLADLSDAELESKYQAENARKKPDDNVISQIETEQADRKKRHKRAMAGRAHIDEEKAKLEEAKRRQFKLDNAKVACDAIDVVTSNVDEISGHIVELARLYIATIGKIEEARQAGQAVKGTALDWNDAVWAMRHYTLNDMTCLGIPVPFSPDATRESLVKAMQSSSASLKNEMRNLLRRAGIEEV